MKRFTLTLITTVALARLTFAQPVDTYINNGVLQSPPQVTPMIDATNFVNRGTFDVFIPVFGDNTFFFQTSSTLNWTNTGNMTAFPGFRFNRFLGTIGGAGTNFSSANFNNANLATINGSDLVDVWATNIINRGLLSSSSSGLISLSGKNVDLTRGRLQISNGNNISYNFWGIGTDANSTDFYGANNASGKPHAVQNPFNLQMNRGVSVSVTNVYAWTNQITPTNAVVQIVYVSNSDPDVTNDVRFIMQQGGRAVSTVQWTSVVTNILGLTFTNQFYLQDTFAVNTNLALATRGFYGIPPAAVNTMSPTNYTFGTFANWTSPNSQTSNTPFDPALINNVNSNQYSIVSVSFAPTTALVLDNLATSTVTNLPGRIEIQADTVLNLDRTTIEGANYLKLTSTNHFVGSTNSSIAVPFNDINLATTNGSLVISNLLAPVIPRFTGDIEVQSARWRVADTNMSTEYFVTIVDASLTGYFPTLINNLALRGTNLTISDFLTVTNTLLLDTERLTFSANTNGAHSEISGLFVESTNILWSESLPRLTHLTNNGEIFIQNALYLAGTRNSPYFQSAFTEPYQAVVNHGEISAPSIRIWANYFENTSMPAPFGNGIIDSQDGPLEIQADTGLLANSMLFSSSAGITLMGNNLTVSNLFIQCFLKLTLAPTNSITDGGIIGLNSYQVQDGFDLLVKPPVGDLLGTTVESAITQNFGEVVNTWAGEDRGCSPAGFVNNVAIGAMILDGIGFDSLFTFRGTGTQNAIYIDELMLLDYATNHTTVGGFNFVGINIEPNMKIYFGSAITPDGDISPQLDGANGGRFCWVQGVANNFSGTNIVYPSGKSYRFNKSLAQSFTIDSDGDGTVNRFDPTPFLNSETVKVSVKVTKQPTAKATVTWQAPARSANFLYSSSTLVNPTWTLVTNFVQGAVSGQATVNEPSMGNGPRYYRVRIDLP